MLAQEWSAQEGKIIPDTMPLTQIITTQMDRVSQERDVMSKSVLKYFDTDLICYPADEPEGLVQEQERVWGALRGWFAEIFGETLLTTASLAALTQPQKAHQKIAAYIHGLDDEHFTILQLVTALSGSVILGIAFTHGRVNARDVFEACFIEEAFKDKIYNAEKYGADPIIEKKQKGTMRDLIACEAYQNAL